MNRIWSLSESTEKGEEVGLISGNRPDDRDAVELAEEEWVSQSCQTQDSVLTPRHFQEKFTYYTFAKAMEKLSKVQEESDSPIRSQQVQSSASMSGVSVDTSSGTQYHIRRAHKTSKSRSGRARDRISEGDNQDATDRSVKSNRTAGNSPPLLEISEEVYAVRQAALTVMEPLTYGWVSAHQSVLNLFLYPGYSHVFFLSDLLLHNKADYDGWWLYLSRARNSLLSQPHTTFSILVYPTTMLDGPCRYLYLPRFVI